MTTKTTAPTVRHITPIAYDRGQIEIVGRRRGDATPEVRALNADPGGWEVVETGCMGWGHGRNAVLFADFEVGVIGHLGGYDLGGYYLARLDDPA